MIVRLICSLYHFWYILYSLRLFFTADYIDKYDIELRTMGIITNVCKLIIQMGMMLLLTFASGLVGDSYQYEVVKALRLQISSEPEKEARAVVSFYSHILKHDLVLCPSRSTSYFVQHLDS